MMNGQALTTMNSSPIYIIFNFSGYLSMNKKLLGGSETLALRAFYLSLCRSNKKKLYKYTMRKCLNSIKCFWQQQQKSFCIFYVKSKNLHNAFIEYLGNI